MSGVYIEGGPDLGVFWGVLEGSQGVQNRDFCHFWGSWRGDPRMLLGLHICVLENILKTPLFGGRIYTPIKPTFRVLWAWIRGILHHENTRFFTFLRKFHVFCIFVNFCNFCEKMMKKLIFLLGHEKGFWKFYDFCDFKNDVIFVRILRFCQFWQVENAKMCQNDEFLK